MNVIEGAARAALKPKDRRPPWQWIEENVGIKNSPYGPRPRFDKTPWLKEPSEVFADNRVHQITLQCCVQGSKSFFMASHGIWALCEDPGPLGYYVQTGEHVKKFAEGRWQPMLERCEPLRKFIRTGDRHATRSAEQNFTHTFAYIMAANESNAQSFSLRYEFNDECAIWTPGILWECHKRTTQWWNRRVVNAGTPGEVDSDFDKCHRAGDMREWRMRCPECGHLQVPDFEKHIKWPTNEETKCLRTATGAKGVSAAAFSETGGKWNYEAVKRLARFECEKCRQQFPHTEYLAEKMNEEGDYVRTNLSAPADQVSFRWNALVLKPSVLSWGDLAVEFIQAARAWKAGYPLPMREFKTKREARSWEPRLINPFRDLPVIEILQKETKETEGEPKARYKKIYWPLQEWLLMAIDVQIDHFWFLIQAWSKNGDECALEAGQLYTWGDLQAKQEEYGILHEDVGVDYSHRPQEVIRECARRGCLRTAKGTQGTQGTQGRTYFYSWVAYQGTADFQFVYENRRTRKKFPLPYAWPPRYGNPTAGLYADNPLRKELAGREVPIIRWSNPSIKDIVMARRDGQVEAKVETLKGPWNAEYARQMHSQKKVLVKPRYGQGQWKYEHFTDDHLLDCRCMIMVRAIRRGLVADVVSAEAPSGGAQDFTEGNE